MKTILFTLLLLLPTILPAAENTYKTIPSGEWGSIAIGKVVSKDKNSKGGSIPWTYVSDIVNKDQAEAEALKRCNKRGKTDTCYIIKSFQNACAAVWMEPSKPAVIFRMADTKFEAIKIAGFSCLKYGKCSLIMAFCSGFPGAESI